jgi:carbamoyl-phosphate synthase large subunit
VRTDVLVCSAGRHVELVRCVREALSDLGLPGRVLTCEASDLNAARHVADAFFETPSAKLASFIPSVQELCERENVLLVLPTVDATLSAYARSAATFADQGTTVAVSSAEVVEIARDKRRTWQFFRQHGIRTVRQAEVEAVVADPGGWAWPLVVKPATGSSSVGVTVARDWLQLHAAVAQPDVVVQELARGQEYTIDMLVDRSGRLLEAVPRQRVEVRAGEVSKARTVRAQPLLDIAEQVAAALPGAFGPLNLQVFWDEVGPPVAIELNARLGGGFPLTHAAGAPFLRWMLETAMDRPLSPAQPWEDDLLMLRYDGSLLVHAAEPALAGAAG